MRYEDILNEINQGKKIYDIPLRVTYYCRVSTDSDVQLNSLDNQLDYYENYIKGNANWTYIDGYIEEGVTGVRVDKRINFRKMIHDAQLNKFDLIVTKEVSRFARDLEDSVHYIRELKKCGVGVFFENQKISTFDENSELVLNLLFNLAQDESKKLSARVKFGHKRAVEKGHVLGSSNITGYKKDKCKLIVIEEEAKFIKIVFELYATGEYGFYKLANKLSDIGYFNKKGKTYDKDTLKQIITNPKYKGFYRGHTYEIIDYRTKRRKKISKEEQVIYKCVDGSIPAIVTEELWNKANEILATRTASYKNNNNWSGGLKYSFSSKIYCKEHNTNFQRSHGSRRKKRPIWACGMYLKYRLNACFSPIIAEVDLYNIIKSIMNNIIPQKNKIVKDLLELYSNIGRTNEYDQNLVVIEKGIKNIEDKKTMAFDLVFNGDLSKEQLKVQFKMFEDELKNLSIKKREILKQLKILNESHNNIDRISRLIQEEIEGGSLEGFIRKFVDEIIVSKIDDGRYNVKLDIFLDLLGLEKVKIKGAKHINGPTEDDILYLENQTCQTVEVKRTDREENKFTYNVYIETL